MSRYAPYQIVEMSAHTLWRPGTKEIAYVIDKGTGDKDCLIPLYNDYEFACYGCSLVVNKKQCVEWLLKHKYINEYHLIFKAV